MEPVVHRGVRTLEQRLQLIAQRIDVSLTKPQYNANGQPYMLKDFVHWLVKGTATSGPASESEPLDAIFRFVRYGIETREDPDDYDYYPAAGRTINSGAEDCDGKVILLNSMLKSIGYRTGFIACSPDGQMWHIYSWVGIHPTFHGPPTEFMPLDPRYGDEPGWEPADRYRRFEKMGMFSKGQVVGLKTVSNGGGWRSWLGL
jgi:hypothetical protein